MDIVLHTTEAGSGEPLVLLHGNGESGDYFRQQIRFFTPQYHVIAVDTRGHGASPRGTAPFTLEQFADDLKQLLDSRGLKRISLLGFSDGGNIALLFTLKYPQFVKKLILGGANLSPSGLKPFFSVPMFVGYAAASLAAPFSAKLQHKKALLGLMATQPHLKPEQLKKISVPTLVLVGTHDLIRDSHSRLIAASIPNAQLQRISGGHSIATEQPEQYNQTVAEFLNGSRINTIPRKSAFPHDRSHANRESSQD